MNEFTRDRSNPQPTGELFRSEPSEVVEVPLLMSIDQIAALEKAAHRQGLTAAEMVRKLLGDFIHDSSPCKA